MQRQVLASMHEEKKMLVIADYVICLSDFTRNVVIEDYKISKNKVAVIPNFIESTSQIVNESGKNISSFNNCRKKYLLYAGRLDENKGVRLLIRAFKDIHRKHPESHLIIVGNGDFSIMNEADGIWEYITFTGNIPQTVLYEIYSRASIGIHPSFNEQCCYTLIEMMMHGLPIIATNSTGVDEMIDDEACCKVQINEEAFEENTFVTALSDKVCAMLDNEEERIITSERMKASYECKYSKSDLLSNYIFSCISQEVPGVLSNEDLLESMDMQSIHLINSRPECMDLDFFGMAGMGLYMLYRIQNCNLSRGARALLSEYLIYLIDWMIEQVSIPEFYPNDNSLNLFVKQLMAMRLYHSGAETLKSSIPICEPTEISVQDIIQNQMKIYNYPF